MGHFLGFIGFVVGGSAVASLAMGTILWVVQSRYAKKASALEAKHLPR